MRWPLVSRRGGMVRKGMLEDPLAEVGRGVSTAAERDFPWKQWTRIPRPARSCMREGRDETRRRVRRRAVLGMRKDARVFE